MSMLLLFLLFFSSFQIPKRPSFITFLLFEEFSLSIFLRIGLLKTSFLRVWCVFVSVFIPEGYICQTQKLYLGFSFQHLKKKNVAFFLASMTQIRNLLSLELMSFYKLTCYFSLPAFKIFSLSLVFRSSIMMYLSIDLFRFTLFEFSPTSWTCMLMSLAKFEEVFSHYFFEYYFTSTVFLFSSGTPMKQMLSLLLSSHMFKLGKFY